MTNDDKVEIARQLTEKRLHGSIVDFEAFLKTASDKLFRTSWERDQFENFQRKRYGRD
jgi:hypothetical protein